MKETIYTIPINDAFDEVCDCPLCKIEEKIDRELVEFTVGASMMEPDFRINTNKKGFCNEHYLKLLQQQKALPLGLILQTYLQEQNKNINEIISSKTKKKGFIKSKGGLKENANNLLNYIKNQSHTCAICEKKEYTLNRYANNIIYLIKTEEEFKKKFESKSGICLNHFALLLNAAILELNEKDFDEFYEKVCDMMKNSLDEIYNDISEFAKSFDYNYKKTPTENVKNSVRRSISKVSKLV